MALDEDEVSPFPVGFPWVSWVVDFPLPVSISWSPQAPGSQAPWLPGLHGTPKSRVLVTLEYCTCEYLESLGCLSNRYGNALGGVFGGGVVGGGTYELVKKCLKSGRFAQLGASMEINKICVRSLDKPRDFEIDSNCTLVTDYDDILKDKDINTVVELMGGVTHAKDVVFAAIKAGKHVVTANKALIATILMTSRYYSKKTPATICIRSGRWIPIIHAMQSEFFADTVNKVMGIMNGTTNFMLCKMEDEGASYDAVLKEAQALGFAEADPTADVEGFDVQAKISILAKLTYVKYRSSTVPTRVLVVFLLWTLSTLRHSSPRSSF